MAARSIFCLGLVLLALAAAPMNKGRAQQSAPPPATAGLTLYDIGTPSGDETEILAVVNRARANPAAEGERLVDVLNTNFPAGDSGIDLAQLLADFQSYPARPPLAFNAELNAAAQFHLGEMITAGAISHYSPNGDYFIKRVESFGYPRPSSENVAGSAKYRISYPADLTEDNYETDTNEPGYGHRLNIMEPDTVRQVEIGVAQQDLCGWNVEDFGADYTPTLLTGAVFTDNAATGFYASGEGVAAVMVTAPGASSFYAVTGESGAYTLPLDLVPAYQVAAYLDAAGNYVQPPPTTAPPPTVTVVFTDSAGSVTTQTVTLHHTVAADGVTTYRDAAGNDRYNNAQADLIEPATAGSAPTPTPSPSPTPAAMPQVTITKEADGTSFVLTRTGDVSGALLVSYKVRGTAVAGQDYLPLSGKKKIKPGKLSAKINVQMLPGARGTLKLKVTNAADYVPATPTQAKINLGQ